LRDYDVIARAYDGTAHELQMACWGRKLPAMPPCVTVMPEVVRPEDLRDSYYANAAYCLITLQEDHGARSAAGCTQLLESMALGRPVIKTRTGALDDDINVEAEGIGLYVPPGDDRALRAAVAQLLADPQQARAMGLRGRALCESYFNMRRFGLELHEFFNRL
jgi:glycosyltransferase involved in cell wall biosynthesis